MMKKKKKQSRSQSSLEPSLDSSSPSPRLLSIFRSKLASGKELKHMFKGIRNKTVPGLSSQSRIVRCPKCRKLLQEPIDATTYKCSGCDSILQAKRWELEGNHNSIPEAFLSSQNRSLSTEIESSLRGSKTSVERGYHSETVYKHETSDIRREWMRRADEFSDSDAYASARSSPYHSRSNASEWTQHDGRYDGLPPVPFYPPSPSPSSAYEYGYNSPFRGSQASASEQSYYHHHHHHQTNQFQRYGSEGWFQESSSVASYDGKYNDLRYHHNLYESSSSAATPHRSTGIIPKSEASSERSSFRNKKKYVKEKKPVLKRHVLPSAGGAPFATCSYCLELLQLPDKVSPGGKHKRYRVRCGSCSGVLTFSIREKTDNVDSTTGLADETDTNHQDKEISPDDSHRSSSDDGSGDRIFKSTYKDKRIKEDERSISNKSLDSDSEMLQLQWKKSSLTSSESIGETSRIHLEQKTSETDNNIFETSRSIDLEECGYEKSETLKQEEMLGDGLGESLETSIEEAETVSRPVSDLSKPLNKNVCETQVLYENTRDTQEDDEYEGERTWGEITGDKPRLRLENSIYVRDSSSERSFSNDETYADTGDRGDTEHRSSTFSDVMSAMPQSPVESSVTENQRFTLTTSRIHEEQSKYEDENLSATLEVGEENGSVVSLEKPIETFETIIDGETVEERSVAHRLENVENSYESFEPLCFEGSGGYESERTWAERDRAGLHLEEYESNYDNYIKPFDLTSERDSTLEPEVEDPDGRSESSSKHSFNGHERSKENETEERKVGVVMENGSSSHLEKCGTESIELNETFESTSERTKTTPGPNDDSNERSRRSSSTDSFSDNESSKEIPTSHEDKPWLKVGEDAFEWTSERAPTFRLRECERYAENVDGSSESSSTEKSEEDGSFLHLEKREKNEAMETFQWTSGRTLTFRLQDEYEEPKTMLEQDKNADKRSESSSRGSFNDHESPMNHVDFLLEDNYEHSLHLEKEVEFDEELEPGNDRLRLCPEDILELETNTFHLEMSQDKPKETSSSIISLDSKAEEESEPHSQCYDTTKEQCEIVGLRLALYQSSPLRSPLTSPIHTPIGSPLHYLMRSPITSPNNSHIVSPMRSPINSSGSLSDVLFFNN